MMSAPGSQRRPSAAAQLPSCVAATPPPQPPPARHPLRGWHPSNPCPMRRRRAWTQIPSMRWTAGCIHIDAQRHGPAPSIPPPPRLSRARPVHWPPAPCRHALLDPTPHAPSPVPCCADLAHQPDLHPAARADGGRHAPRGIGPGAGAVLAAHRPAGGARGQPAPPRRLRRRRAVDGQQDRGRSHRLAQPLAHGTGDGVPPRSLSQPTKWTWCFL